MARVRHARGLGRASTVVTVVAAGIVGTADSAGNAWLGNSGTNTAPIVSVAAPGTTVAGGTNGIKVSGCRP